MPGDFKTNMISILSADTMFVSLIVKSVNTHSIAGKFLICLYPSRVKAFKSLIITSSNSY